MRHWIAAGLLASLAASPVLAQTAGERLREAAYIGTWTGTVRCVHDPGLWPDDECDRRFTSEIGADTLHVQQVVRSKKGRETSGEVGAGKWGFFRLETNAIAVAMDTGEDTQGHWVETWTFAMTLKDPDHLLVHWTRVVNNTELARDAKGATFSILGIGELAREGR